MKRQLKMIGLIGMIAMASACGAACTVVNPDAGTVGVLVDKPWFAGHGGVEETPVQPGLTYAAFTTDAVYVNMQARRTDLEFDDMMTSSGVPVSFHVVLSWRITDAVSIVNKFGTDTDKDGAYNFFYRNLDQPIRTAVRDAVKKRDMQEMAISQTAADAVGAEVTTATDAIIKAIGLPIQLLNLSVGRVNPPDAIKHQRIATAEQEQRVITEQQRKLAEDQRKAAEESRAQADNAYNERMRLTPEQYVRLKQIEALSNVCASGKCTFVSGVTPFLSVGKD